MQCGLQIFENPFQAFVRGDRPLGSKPRYKIHCNLAEKNEPRRANFPNESTSRWGIAPLTLNIFIYHKGVGLPQWTCDTGCFFFVTVQLQQHLSVNNLGLSHVH